MEKRAIGPIPIDLKTLNSMPRDDKITVIQEEKFLLFTKPPHYQADKKIKSNWYYFIKQKKTAWLIQLNNIP